MGKLSFTAQEENYSSLFRVGRSREQREESRAKHNLI